MSGICVVGGVDDAEYRAKVMTENMARFGHTTIVKPILNDLAIGKAQYRIWKDKTRAVNDKDGVAVIIDGEVYNENGLEPDPENLIRDLYNSGGMDQVAYLNGSFSVIIADTLKNRVTLASDRFGSRTIFYWVSANQFAAASRLTSLLTDDRVSRRLSVQGICELVTYQRTIAGHTQYADISGTAGAQIVIIENGAYSKRRTRKLSWNAPDFNEDEGAVKLANAIKNSARRRTSDDARHGVMLSGGLDARFVLAAITASGGKAGCATVGSHENTEVSIARQTAEKAGAPFKFYKADPYELVNNLDGSVEASDGLFTAPVNLFGSLPQIAEDCDVLLSGHGLDYTFRGYYLPCATLRLAGSVTRFPKLRAIPDGAPATVAASLRVGIKASALSKAFTRQTHGEINQRRAAAMEEALSSADIDDPYNAWDTFILHCLGRHYAYSDFVAIDTLMPHRAVTFDPEVIDIYFSMPPAWRASGKMAHKAMMILGSELMSLPDANHGFKGENSFWLNIALVMGRAALRRVGFMKPQSQQDPVMTDGSWVSFPELLRRDQVFVERLNSLSSDRALLDTGLFDSNGIEKVVREHSEGKENHAKFLVTALSLASWLGKHSYSGVAE